MKIYFVVALIFITLSGIGCSNTKSTSSTPATITNDDINSPVFIDAVVEEGDLNNIYKNEQLGFSLIFPKNWVYFLSTDEKNQSYRASFYLEDDVLGVRVEVEKKNFDEFIQDIYSDASSLEADGREIVKVEDIILSGYNAKKYTLDVIPLDQDGFAYTVEKEREYDTFIKYGDYVIRIIGGYGIPALNSNNDSLVLGVINSFQSL